MQTFLPYESFIDSADCLDRQRLGKQRVEAFQILNALKDGSKSRWRNHPAVRMWSEYENALGYYMNIIIMEWVSRGYKNNMIYYTIPKLEVVRYPEWLGDYRLHLSHRCNLYRKNPDHYFKYFGNNLDRKAPYWWPVELKNKKMNEHMNEYWKK
jgi:Pyrimidine dimer DNA glycosylase